MRLWKIKKEKNNWSEIQAREMCSMLIELLAWCSCSCTRRIMWKTVTAINGMVLYLMQVYGLYSTCPFDMIHIHCCLYKTMHVSHIIHNNDGHLMEHLFIWFYNEIILFEMWCGLPSNEPRCNRKVWKLIVLLLLVCTFVRFEGHSSLTHVRCANV